MKTHQRVINGQVRKFILDHFIYSNVALTSLAPGTSASVTIPIEADSMFTVVKSSYVADILGAAQTDSTRVIPLISVAITDSGSGRQLQNTPVPISSLAGHEGLPMVWPVPREFLASSTITMTFTNNSTGVTYNNVVLSLIGFKSFAQ